MSAKIEFNLDKLSGIGQAGPTRHSESFGHEFESCRPFVPGLTPRVHRGGGEALSLCDKWSTNPHIPLHDVNLV